MTAHTSIALPFGSTPPPSLLVDIPHAWAIFKRRFWVFLATALTTLVLVTIVTFQLTPKYSAEARVVLNARETQALDVSAIIAGMSPDAAVVDTEVEIIRSRSLATKVAEKLELSTDPAFNPTLEKKEEWFSAFLPGQLKDKPLSEDIIRQQIVDRLLETIEVERAGITYAIVITATEDRPEVAARIANGFAEQYIVDQLDQKFETYNLVTTYLGKAVEANRDQLRIAEDAVERYRSENGLLSAEGSLLSEQQIADIQAQLIIQEADLAEREAKLKSVNRRLSLGAGVDAISDVLSSPVITSLRTKQADLARRRADLETRYGPRHPVMDNIMSEEADLEAQIDSEIDRIVAGLRNDVEVATQRVTSLKESINSLKLNLSTDNKALVRLRELERDAQVSRRSYEELLERSQQAELFEDLAEADARVADRASVPTKPSFPHTGLNILLGLFLGTALGGMMVVLTEIFDNGLRTQEDIERQLGMGTLTLIPQLSKDKLTEDISTPQDYVVERPLSAFAESYRTLRTGLVLGAKSGKSKKGGRVVALTSAVSGEGKTSSALCLGRISALAGDKVLVIDCDIRRRMLSAAFEKGLFEKQGAEDMGAAAEIELRGLAELIRGDVPFRTVVMRDEKTELDILPVSKDHSGVGDLFGIARFKVLLEKLRTRYDLIILDTPPLTAVAEARAAVNAADVAVQCVRWKKTPLALAKSAAKILRGIKTPLAGAALTQVDMRAQAGYGYEGSYKYYAQHGKYYFD